MSAGRLGELGEFILRGEAIKLYRSFLRLAKQAPEGSQADLRAEVRREFEAARAASQRRKQQQRQQSRGEGGDETPPPPPATGSARRRALPPVAAGGAGAAGGRGAAAGGDDDAYASKKALSDGREALRRLRDMIELRR